MLKMVHLAVLAALCALTVLPGEAATLKDVGPLATAAQIRAAHGAATGPVLRLVYGSPQGGKIEVTLGTDYVFFRQSGTKDSARTTLTDFALKRQIQLHEAAKTFANVSLYAIADFRILEIHNRHFLRQMLSKVKPGAAPWSAYFDQQELGLVDPEDEKVAITRTATATGGLRFVVDGGLVAAFEPSREKLSAAEVQGLSRLLHHNFNLHPEMMAAILDAKAIPQEIVVLEGRFDHRSERHWILQSFARDTAAYPLTADYRSDLPDSAMATPEPLKTVLPVMLQAVAGHYHNGPRRLDDLRSAEDAALAQGHLLQAFLLDSELGLQYRSGVLACFNGNVRHEDCSRGQEIIDRWKADAPTMALMQLFGLERSDPKAAIAQRNRIDRSGLANAYILDLWNGDTILQSGIDGDAAALIASAIKGNPYVGGFYKDFGDSFRGRYAPDEAWLCYDLARLLPGGETAPVVDTLANMESAIESRAPQFF